MEYVKISCDCFRCGGVIAPRSYFESFMDLTFLDDDLDEYAPEDLVKIHLEQDPYHDHDGKISEIIRDS